MASIRRGTIVRDIIDSLKLQVGNVIPDQTSDKLVLTYDFSNVRVCDVVKNLRLSNETTGTTSYTTPSDKDFYLCGLTCSYSKDANSTATQMNMRCIVGGETRRLVELAGTTLTAQNQAIAISFPVPIKVDRNTLIALYTTAATAAIQISATIWGYTIDG